MYLATGPRCPVWVVHCSSDRITALWLLVATYYLLLTNIIHLRMLRSADGQLANRTQHCLVNQIHVDAASPETRIAFHLYIHERKGIPPVSRPQGVMPEDHCIEIDGECASPQPQAVVRGYFADIIEIANHELRWTSRDLY
ncbi:hypothetical protein CC78DRAFT_268672 [Lojkania enalia]|uniref:Uncharacterized protein n=1 Tax=Lojkania enalia TaxID=147567 RepID=A0A9P4K8B7_9PLEO|nr:hypothetical protein CC78DRAFT_268672 [Didymosphaeria enalia]